MPMTPEFRAGGWGFLLAIVFVLAVIIMLVFGSSGLTVLVGAVLLAVVLAILYYLGVRVDRWARGGGTRGGET